MGAKKTNIPAICIDRLPPQNKEAHDCCTHNNQSEHASGGGKRKTGAHIMRLIATWFGFSSLYAMFSVCPFCGQAGCPVGVGGAGIIGGFFALIAQSGKLFLSRFGFRAGGKKKSDAACKTDH